MIMIIIIIQRRTWKFNAMYVHMVFSVKNVGVKKGTLYPVNVTKLHNAPTRQAKGLYVHVIHTNAWIYTMSTTKSVMSRLHFVYIFYNIHIKEGF